MLKVERQIGISRKTMSSVLFWKDLIRFKGKSGQGQNNSMHFKNYRPATPDVCCVS